MPTITDLIGPAGPLEALSGPSRPPAQHRQGGGRLRAPASAVRRDDAHEGGVSGSERAGAHRMRGAALQLPRRRPQCRRVRPGRGREGGLQGRARLYGRRAIRAHRCGRRGSPSARGWRSRSARRRPARLRAHRHRAAGGDVGLRADLHLRGHAREHEAQVLRAGGSRRGVPDRRDVGRSTASCTSRRSWSSSTAPITCSKARRRKSARRSRTCCRTLATWKASHERRRHRHRRADAGRQSAKRRAARRRVPTKWPRS